MSKFTFVAWATVSYDSILCPPGRNTFVAVTSVTVTEGKRTAIAGGKKSVCHCLNSEI